MTPIHHHAQEDSLFYLVGGGIASLNTGSEVRIDLPSIVQTKK